MVLLAYRVVQFNWSNFSIIRFQCRLLKIDWLPASDYLLLAARFWPLAACFWHLALIGPRCRFAAWLRGSVFRGLGFWYQRLWYTVGELKARPYENDKK